MKVPYVRHEVPLLVKDHLHGKVRARACLCAHACAWHVLVKTCVCTCMHACMRGVRACARVAVCMCLCPCMRACMQRVHALHTCTCVYAPILIGTLVSALCEWYGASHACFRHASHRRDNMPGAGRCSVKMADMSPASWCVGSEQDL